MKTLDIIILIPLLIGAYKGYKKGLLREIVSIVALVLAIVLGFKLLDWGIDALAPYFEDWGKFLPIAAFILIFIGVIVAVNIIGRIIKTVLDMTLLGGLDSFSGGVLGILKWAFGVSVVLWLGQSIEISVPEQMEEGTHIYPLVASIAPYVFDAVSVYLPFIQELFDTLKSFIIDNV